MISTELVSTNAVNSLAVRIMLEAFVGCWIAFSKSRYVFQHTIDVILILIAISANHAVQASQRVLSITCDEYFRLELHPYLVHVAIWAILLRLLTVKKYWILQYFTTVAFGSALVIHGFIGLLNLGTEHIEGFSIGDDKSFLFIMLCFSIAALSLSARLQLSYYKEKIHSSHNSCERIAPVDFENDGYHTTIKEIKKLRRMCRENPELYKNLENKDRFEGFLRNPRDLGIQL